MHPDDRAKTTFVTSVGVYNYKIMPFGLKNAGATYQRLVDQVFAEQKGRNMEVYVDDSIVKSKDEKDHVADLAETFATLRKHQMKLNPKKCLFGVKFISKASDKGLPFFKALKLPKSKELIWEEEQKLAFQQLREHLANLPMLARPAEGEILYLYVAVSPATIVVLTDQPLEKVPGKVEKSGRLTKWAFELTEFSISCQPRAAIKAQALADFLAECSYQETLDEGKKIWNVFTDGSATVNGSGAGLVITFPEGKNCEYGFKFSFKDSNNKVEYEVAIAGLELCIALEAEHVCLKTDSQLVANQIWGEYEAKEPSMISYLAKIKSVIAKLRTFEIELYPRGQNAQVDALSKLASSTLTELNRSVYVEVRRNRSIDQEAEEVYLAEYHHSLRHPKLFVFDHGRQFDNLPLKRYTDKFGIKLAYSAVCHPQSNGQAEAANKQILKALKKRVEDQKSKWIEELPGTLWSLRTTEKEATGHSPFELVYGSEASLPVEIGSESLRVNQFSAEENEHLMKESLDFLDEIRDSARDRMAAYKQRISKFYNQRVQARLLKVGDLVLWNAAAVQKSRIHGKLSANWEGPYEIYDELQPGTYRLR
ncbi:uncharacterized protein LOC110688614 [Chenopodium quinoa]|uniref:uncharacterized protein LOC110688614 n=1 Tax=Chenopodium quinoa TaxID=63459 RepID=UPI000B799A8F|nr:uncharacterized protein LOC110688614 [Chenopodium quinoa]